MRMPAPGRQPPHLEHDLVGDVLAERRAEPGERAVVLEGIERRLQLCAHDVPLRSRHGERRGRRPDERDGDERGCPEHAPRVRDRTLDTSRAGDGPALRDRDAHEPDDDGDEEQQARLERDGVVDDARGRFRR